MKYKYKKNIFKKLSDRHNILVQFLVKNVFVQEEIDQIQEDFLLTPLSISAQTVYGARMQY